MTLAIVNVLPEPVTPRRVWCFFSSLSPRTRASMAWGWSPAGGNGLTSSNSDLDGSLARGRGTEAEMGAEALGRRRADPPDATIEVGEGAERCGTAFLGDPPDQDRAEPGQGGEDAGRRSVRVDDEAGRIGVR